MFSATPLVAAAVLAQSLLAPKPSTLQHVQAAPTVTRTAAGKVTLALDVTPNPGIHVYAPGAKDFTPVSLVLTPRAGVAASKAVYPKADPVPVGGVDDAPAYRKAFRIEQPVTVTAAKGGDVVIAGVLNYQSCDDRVCYPVASLPVTWTIKN
jgi:DsbC/DsbD-like thiol-disulfide interchange protein